MPPCYDTAPEEGEHARQGRRQIAPVQGKTLLGQGLPAPSRSRRQRRRAPTAVQHPPHGHRAGNIARIAG